VGQTTVFPNAKDRAAIAKARQPEASQGVPCFTATFLTEALGDKPIGTFGIKGLEVFSAGKRIELTKMSGDNVQAFEYRVFQDFLDFTKPKVADAKRAKIIRFYRFGSVPDSRPFSLKLQAGFDKDVEDFAFDSLQIRYATESAAVGGAEGRDEEAGWSEAVNGMQARVAVERKNVVEGVTLLAVYLELRNLSEAADTKTIHLDLRSITASIIDSEDKLVPSPDAVDYGGRVVGPWDLRLAPDSSQRLNITSHGLGIRRNLAAILDLGPPNIWEFKPGETGPYYLKASVEVAKDPADANAWSGKIELPKARIPLSIERAR
jgi:hypothetical protein